MFVWSSRQFLRLPALSNGSADLLAQPLTPTIPCCSHTSKEQLFLKNSLQLPVASAERSCGSFREAGEFCPEVIRSQQAQ